MSSRNAGRQSPSPSRLSGRQQPDLPGWTGKAEQQDGGVGAIKNPSARHEGEGEREGGKKKQDANRGEEVRVVDGQSELDKLESNPEHILEKIARKKSGIDFS